jgi:tetratricopeptide (TPR) repeat protein
MGYREQMLGLFRGLNNRVFEGWSLYQLGQTYHFQGDYDSAATYYERALRIGRETNDWEIEAKALTYKGLLSHHLADDRAAREYCEQVLRIIPDLDLVRALDLVYVYVILGHALAGLGHWTESTEAYRQALTTRRSFLVVEPQAGLARVALGQGDSAGALAYVREILDYMAERPALEGAKEPLRVYLTCISVLRANGDLRANKILDKAYRMLQKRAATIEDRNLRHAYLENVTAHREIVALWEETSHL